MKIHALTLHTNYYAGVLGFYKNTLGLSSFGENEFQSGDSKLIFRENPQTSGIYHFAFNIPCNQIREAMRWLQSRGVELVADAAGNTLIDFPRWNAEAAYFFDPGGNIVEFIARRDLPNASDKSFGPDSLLAISEVGIVVPDVLDWNARAAREYGVFPFEKSPPQVDFSALGTDEGLFIVVPEGRVWFLTDTPATREPLEVVFSNRAGKRFAYPSYGFEP